LLFVLKKFGSKSIVTATPSPVKPVPSKSTATAMKSAVVSSVPSEENPPPAKPSIVPVAAAIPVANGSSSDSGIPSPGTIKPATGLAGSPPVFADIMKDLQDLSPAEANRLEKVQSTREIVRFLHISVFV
jgi:hypothetical protein